MNTKEFNEIIKSQGFTIGRKVLVKVATQKPAIKDFIQAVPDNWKSSRRWNEKINKLIAYIVMVDSLSSESMIAAMHCTNRRGRISSF